ncbi:MAG: AAA family ATPase [Candidatus Micrarchaeota archaeon]|nr:AAA family ATPase [Candidatus Micrarchaeota archaeon]
MTGTPGTGKSTFAKRLVARLKSDGINCSLIEVNDIVHKHKLYSGTDKSGAKIVRMAALNSMLSKNISGTKGIRVVVGHLIPDLRIKPNLTVVTRLDLDKLERRLKARRYGKEKMRENLISEAVDYCGQSSIKNGGEQYQVESDVDKRDAIRYVALRAKGLKSRRPKAREYSKLGQLVHLIDRGNKYGF